MYLASEKRYDSIHYSSCGNSELKLPAISFGLWHNFGDNADYENMKSLCFTAFDNGITHFDLANNYESKYGSTETNLGKVLKEEFSSYRDELLISTKTGYINTKKLEQITQLNQLAYERGESLAQMALATDNVSFNNEELDIIKQIYYNDL